MLFKAFAKTYIDYVQIQLKPKTVAFYRYVLRQVLLPCFGEFDLIEITRRQVFEMCQQLESTPVLANRSVAVGSAMYRRAAHLECVPHDCNPFRGGKIYREMRRDRFLSAEECNRVAHALNKLERAQTVSPYAIAGIRTLMLTGARLTEIEKLRWDEVNLSDHCIVLRDSKTGPRTLELPKSVARMLENLQPPKHARVFPGRGGGQIRLNFVWRKVRIIAEIEDVRLHDLRHTYATWAVQDGVPIPTVARLMGHSTEWTTARYLHANRAQSAAAAARIAGVIEQEMRPR